MASNSAQRIVSLLQPKVVTGACMSIDITTIVICMFALLKMFDAYLFCRFQLFRIHYEHKQRVDLPKSKWPVRLDINVQNVSVHAS